ncbi:MAG: hypothetical protein Q8O89_07680 [Nanoarchaeota archaeon]|nr:hypothetical protein [Nanoarchaeota archaeon]
MENKQLLLICPKCKHRMKYQSTTADLAGKSKRCVYCGRSFKVLRNILN